ncbi:hypothetical protein EG328_003158 [Venturia inaequalis]|uniref:Uncharacterized protein n=1 Tax=Venturia inaequalis TaxID=5025 RepID=A0A8H3VGM9_VENIN|nr:hypothetical protein EG328_003158 [Venturia inaequalis]KAE9989777.1 hypothetical protein EG327_002244 [Venturia inaequalis]
MHDHVRPLHKRILQSKWIRTQASISCKAFFGHQFKAPKIWLCTGVQLATNGDVHTGSARHNRASVGAGVYAGAIAGGPPGVLVAQTEGGHARGAEAGSHFGYEGERVWAAQFMEVSFKFSSALDPEDKDHSKTIAKIQLEDVADLKTRGLRASQDITISEEKEDVTETKGIRIDDHPYVKLMKITEWASYNECLKFSADADASERGIDA